MTWHTPVAAVIALTLLAAPGIGRVPRPHRHVPGRRSDRDPGRRLRRSARRRVRSHPRDRAGPSFLCSLSPSRFRPAPDRRRSRSCPTSRSSFPVPICRVRRSRRGSCPSRGSICRTGARCLPTVRCTVPPRRTRRGRAARVRRAAWPGTARPASLSTPSSSCPERGAPAAHAPGPADPTTRRAAVPAAARRGGARRRGRDRVRQPSAVSRSARPRTGGEHLARGRGLRVRARSRRRCSSPRSRRSSTWKTRKGVPAATVTTEWIAATYAGT